VALCTTLAKALEIYDEFVPAEDGYARLFLNEYESEVRLPATPPKQIAERYVQGKYFRRGLEFFWVYAGYTLEKRRWRREAEMKDQLAQQPRMRVGVLPTRVPTTPTSENRSAERSSHRLAPEAESCRHLAAYETSSFSRIALAHLGPGRLEPRIAGWYPEAKSQPQP
jgi:hypothetical protein